MPVKYLTIKSNSKSSLFRICNSWRSSKILAFLAKRQVVYTVFSLNLNIMSRADDGFADSHISYLNIILILNMHQEKKT